MIDPSKYTRKRIHEPLSSLKNFYQELIQTYYAPSTVHMNLALAIHYPKGYSGQIIRESASDHFMLNFNIIVTLY